MRTYTLRIPVEVLEESWRTSIEVKIDAKDADEALEKLAQMLSIREKKKKT